MIIYFSGTGNSLATARKIAEALNDKVITMAEAVRQDLRGEECIGLVYPSYDFAPPPAVQRFLPMLEINPKAYVFVIISCGAQAGISSWYAKHVFKQKGIEVAYTHKIRMPDCAGIALQAQSQRTDVEVPEVCISDAADNRRRKSPSQGSSLQQMGPAGMDFDEHENGTKDDQTLYAHRERSSLCRMWHLRQNLPCWQYHHARSRGHEAIGHHGLGLFCLPELCTFLSASGCGAGRQKS